MPLPRPNTDSQYRVEEVDLQPGGSTITVESPSDNPFDMADEDIEIVTQDSGGMAGPDPRMRSKRILYKGKTAQAHARAKPYTTPAHHLRPRGVHINAGFIPGMGTIGDEGEEFELGNLGAVPSRAGRAPRKAKSPRQVVAVHAGHKLATAHVVSQMRRGGFMPGMGSLDDLGDAGPAPTQNPGESDAAFSARQQAWLLATTEDTKNYAAAAEAKRSAANTAATSSVLNAGLQALAKSFDARAANAAAAAAESKARGDIATANSQAAQAQSLAQQAAAARAKAGMSTGAKIGIGVGAVVALSLVAYLLLHKG